MSEEENEDKTTDSDKTGNKQKGSDFWSLWPKRTGQMTSPKQKRSRKLFTKSVFISDSDKVGVTMAQMSKSIDGSLTETTAPHDLPKIVVTPAKRDRSRSSTGSHERSGKSTPVDLLQCLAVPSSPSSDNVYVLAGKGKLGFEWVILQKK